MSQLWSDNIDPSEFGNRAGFFSRLGYYMIGPIAALGLFLSVWYLVIPGIMHLDARENEIHVETYARVRAMDNHVTHGYIVECLEDGIITWNEYREIRNMTEKYPHIEAITRGGDNE